MIALIGLLQFVMLSAGLGVLFVNRHVISRDAWLSFSLRDLAWIPCLIIEYLIIAGILTIAELEIALLIQFGIIIGLLYSTIKRIQYQRREAAYHARMQQELKRLGDAQERIDRLEAMKDW